MNVRFQRRGRSRRSAGFQTCCVADFQIGRASKCLGALVKRRFAGLETRDTADLEACATMDAVRRSAASEHGFTLLELMVVLVLMAVMAAMIVPEMKGTYENALLRSTSRDLVSVLNLAYSRAISVNQIHRVRLDQSNGKYFVEARVRGGERGGEFMPIQNVSGSEGKLDQRISIQIRNSVEEISETQTSPSFSDSVAESREWDRDNTISFYPDGTADRRDIQLQDREGFRLSLQINPITARVRIVETERN